MYMDRIAIKSLTARVLFGVYALAAGVACAQRVEPTFPTPAAFHNRTQQLIVGTLQRDVRKIGISGTRSARNGGRIHLSAGNTILRIRLDARRERLWILDIGNVHVFDLARNRMVRSIALPNWFYADEGTNCLPDLQLDEHGAAFVSDNMQPKLWRIDADSFSVYERAVSLDSQRNVDAGFSALSIGEGGVMFAAMAAPGSLWRIDTGTFRAEQIGLSVPIHGACALEVLNSPGQRKLTLFVLTAGRTSFDVGRIDMLPDSKEAQVDVTALGSVAAPAGLVAWSGALYVASTDGAVRVFRRLRGKKALFAQRNF
jgi:hypothetical protein